MFTVYGAKREQCVKSQIRYKHRRGGEKTASVGAPTEATYADKAATERVVVLPQISPAPGALTPLHATRTTAHAPDTNSCSGHRFRQTKQTTPSDQS
ncbi:unnamed protein product, partial [Iphiclides podalirius]